MVSEIRQVGKRYSFIVSSSLFQVWIRLAKKLTGCLEDAVTAAFSQVPLISSPWHNLIKINISMNIIISEIFKFGYANVLLKQAGLPLVTTAIQSFDFHLSKQRCSSRKYTLQRISLLWHLSYWIFFLLIILLRF